MSRRSTKEELPLKPISHSLFSHPNRTRHMGMMWDELRQLKDLPQVDKWLSDKFRSLKQYGSTDRKHISDCIFLIFRYGIWIMHEYFAESFDRKVPSPAETWGILRGFDWDSILPKLTMRLELAKPSHLTLRELLIFEGIHPWFQKYLEKRSRLSGWVIEDWMELQNNRPPLWLRLNHLQLRPQILSNLKADGFIVEELGTALKVVGAKGIYNNESYRNGLVEIQDYSSQCLGEKFSAKPGEIIWDACAGGGGKTMQIASHLHGKGAVIASDIRSWKLEEVKRRAKKAKFHNVRTVPWDSTQTFVLPREAQSRGGFDKIFVDAPCSSSGTWRRNPDTRFRIGPVELASLNSLQYSILSQAAKSLKKGGLLAYATCSFLPEENEEIIEKFCLENPDFTVQSLGMEGAPYLDADSMFIAILVRQAT